jgi:hypothetical protein
MGIQEEGIDAALAKRHLLGREDEAERTGLMLRVSRIDEDFTETPGHVVTRTDDLGERTTVPDVRCDGRSGISRVGPAGEDDLGSV